MLALFLKTNPNGIYLISIIDKERGLRREVLSFKINISQKMYIIISDVSQLEANVKAYAKNIVLTSVDVIHSCSCTLNIVFAIE